MPTVDTKNEDQNTERAERRPYSKPGVVTEGVFETMALSCASGIGCSEPPPLPRS